MNNFNRNHKDSVFVDLFANDITAKENFVSLYNALHKTNLDPQTTEIKPVMLENILYMSYYNDISMLIDGKIVVLIEHQSTVNQNMPFRFLEYIARVYEKIKNKNFPLEITVKIININIEKDNPILHKCKPLKQYSDFVNQVRICMKENVENPFTTAINLSIKNGILSDYLKRKSTEIRNMLFGEYDYDTDIRVQRREAFEDGVEEGISQGAEQKAIETAKNFLKLGLSIELIAEGTGLSEENIKKIKEELESK
ncbi:MAG: Rpn family recombination-promoting nuclease/putative transposase [Treponema sp.]|nr:Rpn family recombination-promoting nuclease/putative transposase [Treponema sp.]